MTLRVSSTTSTGPYVPASRQRWQLDAFADGATLSERHGRMISGSRHGGPPPRLQRGPRARPSGSRPGRWLTSLTETAFAHQTAKVRDSRCLMLARELGFRP